VQHLAAGDRCRHPHRKAEPDQEQHAANRAGDGDTSECSAMPAATVQPVSEDRAKVVISGRLPAKPSED
jgi:hypothetical protein